MILGLDISTSITGVCIYDKEEGIILSDYIDLRKKKDIFEKGEVVRTYIKKIYSKYEITDIVIEKSLQTFRSGFSSAKTLSLLASFNGLTSWFCYDIFNIKPSYISASSARKAAGLTVPRGKKGKEVVYEWVVKDKGFIAEELTKAGNPKPYMYDKCDAIIIAMSVGND